MGKYKWLVQYLWIEFSGKNQWEELAFYRQGRI